MNFMEDSNARVREGSPTSFLAVTNDAICNAVTKIIQLVSHSSNSNHIRSSEDKSSSRGKSRLKTNGNGNNVKERLPEITLDEVRCHDNLSDCWIVVYDRVFDITGFLLEHPGGEEVLLEHAGRDATLAFRGVGHSRQAFKALENYSVGILPEKERIYSRGGKKVLEMLTASLSFSS